MSKHVDMTIQKLIGSRMCSVQVTSRVEDNVDTEYFSFHDIIDGDVINLKIVPHYVEDEKARAAALTMLGNRFVRIESTISKSLEPTIENIMNGEFLDVHLAKEISATDRNGNDLSYMIKDFSKR